MSFNPTEILPAVDAGADRLEAAADNLYSATKTAHEAEHAYEQEFEKELLTIYHEAKRAGDRMPAEDVRKAIAHEQIHKRCPEVYANHLKARAELAAQEKLVRSLEKSVSAKQSVLRALGGVGA